MCRAPAQGVNASQQEIVFEGHSLVLSETARAGLHRFAAAINDPVNNGQPVIVVPFGDAHCDSCRLAGLDRAKLVIDHLQEQHKLGGDRFYISGREETVTGGRPGGVRLRVGM